jgi:CheY-like chemotaxis protein
MNNKMKNNEKNQQKIENAKKSVEKPLFKEMVESAMTGKKGKVLVVEDDESYMHRIKSQLEAQIDGKEIITAVNLVDAISAFNENKDIELVVTDMSYPEMEGDDGSPESGVSLIRHVKSKNPVVKVIAQSSSEYYLKQAENAGADSTINKFAILQQAATKITNTKDIAKVKTEDKETEQGANQEKQKKESLLVVCEVKGIKDKLGISGAKVEEANLHDSVTKLRESKYSKVIIIGDSKYISHAKHDLYHVGQFPTVVIQTNKETKETSYHYSDNEEYFKFPIDAKKFSEAIGAEAHFDTSQKQSKYTERGNKVLLVSDWNQYRSSLEKALKCLTDSKIETCSTNEFADKDTGKYKKVILVEPLSDEKFKDVRDYMPLYDVGREPTPVIYLSWNKDVKPRENEVVLKQPINLPELIRQILK